MKVILEMRHGVTDLDNTFFNFIAGECNVDETDCVFNTAFGVLMVKRSDVGVALLLPDDADLPAMVEGKGAVWLVN